MLSDQQRINEQQLLVIELQEIHALIEVCHLALKSTGASEDACTADVLRITTSKLWELSQQQEKKTKALELDLAGGE